MAGPSRNNSNPGRFCDRFIDFGVTIACWGYFTLGFIIFFSVFYCIAYLSPSGREYRFQCLNSLFYRGFFKIVRLLAPRHHWLIEEEVAQIRGSVVVCNHLSYLDPLLLISLFKRQKTIVKTSFFKVPIFGWVLRHSGYFPADSNGKYTQMMITQMEHLGAFLADGGNLFIFPEGTRSRDGEIGELNRGALKIARFSKAPVTVVYLANTDRLFTPGRFLFNTRRENEIKMSIIDRISADKLQDGGLAELERGIKDALMARTALEQRQARSENRDKALDKMETEI